MADVQTGAAYSALALEEIRRPQYQKAEKYQHMDVAGVKIG